MGKQIELKRLILDFNYIINRLNKAEKYFEEKKDDDNCEKYIKLYTDLIKRASMMANRIEQLLGRPLTGYESLHGINM